mgnify:CR=1 FL=1
MPRAQVTLHISLGNASESGQYARCDCGHPHYRGVPCMVIGCSCSGFRRAKRSKAREIGVTRFWVKYDGGTTEEKKVAGVAHKLQGKQIATTGDNVVVDVPSENASRFENNVEMAGFTVDERSDE